MNRPLSLIATGMMVLLAACKPGTPSQYIQPDDMEDILVDYHTAMAMVQQEDVSQPQRDFNQSLYMEAILQKYGVSRSVFDSSMVYYSTRADRLASIYDGVCKRLEENALVMGASEGDIGKYAQYNATGDTANIWPDRTAMLMMPLPPYNRWSFTIEADSTFRIGDAFLMQFMSDYMYQGGAKKGVLYVAVEFTDTVIGHYMNVYNTGLTQLRIAEVKGKTIKALKGYFYLGNDDLTTSTVRLLFLNNVQLIRFHTEQELHEEQHDEQQEEPSDSLQRDSVGRRLLPDSLGSGDSVRHRQLSVSADSGAATHRMAARRSMP